MQNPSGTCFLSLSNLLRCWSITKIQKNGKFWKKIFLLIFFDDFSWNWPKNMILAVFKHTIFQNGVILKMYRFSQLCGPRRFEVGPFESAKVAAPRLRLFLETSNFEFCAVTFVSCWCTAISLKNRAKSQFFAFLGAANFSKSHDSENVPKFWTIWSAGHQSTSFEHFETHSAPGKAIGGNFKIVFFQGHFVTDVVSVSHDLH